MNEILPIHMIAVYGFCIIATLFNPFFLTVVYFENKNSKEQYFHEREIFYYILFSISVCIYVFCQSVLLTSRTVAVNFVFHRIQLAAMPIGVIALFRLPGQVFDKPPRHPNIDRFVTIYFLVTVPFYFTTLTVFNETAQAGNIIQGRETVLALIFGAVQLLTIIYSFARGLIYAGKKVRAFKEKTGQGVIQSVKHLKAGEKYLIVGYLFILLSGLIDLLRMAGIMSYMFADVAGIPFGMTIYSLLVAILQMKEYRSTIDRLTEIKKSIYKKVSGIEEEYKQLLATIVDIQERDDEYTAGHSRRVMEYSEEIAKKIGLRPEIIAKVSTTGILHDIGKVGIDKSILNKPASLTPEEFEEVEKHSRLGSDIISPHEAFGEIAKYVLHHHEKLDGTGYPSGIRGEDIPAIARIIAVADIYDALSSKRPYRDELPKQKCLDIMADMAKNNKIDAEIFAKFATIITMR